MEHNFKGKTVLVTGAGWGIGAATALLYASCGANVIVSDISREGSNNAMETIKDQKGDIIYIKTDVSNALACEKLIKRIIDTYGSLDIACNNSVIFSEFPNPADGYVGASDNHAVLNLHSLNNCMQYEIEAMQRQGGGVIINTASIMGVTGSTPLSPYVAAKYGMAMLLKKIPGEYPAIHINTIAPAFISNAFLKDVIQKETDGGMKLFPVERRRAIQEVAGLVLWLSSDETYILLPATFNVNYN